MGIVVDVSAPTLDYVLYGDNSNVVTNYLTSQLNSFTGHLSDLGRSIYNRLETSRDFINSSLTQFQIRNELGTQLQSVMIDQEYIKELLILEEIKQASLTMQRWVMANPQVKQLYVDQDIDGYSNTYVNHFGDGVGKDDYNYRRVMDGVIVDKDDGSWEVNHYFEELLPGDRELTLFEKANVLNTWSYMEWLLENNKIDFTNQSSKNVKRNK